MTAAPRPEAEISTTVATDIGMLVLGDPGAFAGSSDDAALVTGLREGSARYRGAGPGATLAELRQAAPTSRRARGELCSAVAKHLARTTRPGRALPLVHGVAGGCPVVVRMGAPGRPAGLTRRERGAADLRVGPLPVRRRGPPGRAGG